MMLSNNELPHYYYDDYTIWKGEWELIEGIPYAMTPSPVFRHQFISQKISRYLDELLDDCPNCQALAALDWIVSEDTVLQPDNMVICYAPEGDFLTRPPALIFEILSPSTAKKDRVTKFRIYQQEGVLWYCLVDPEKQLIEIYKRVDDRYIKQGKVGRERYLFDLEHCQISLDFSMIWPT
jgi:Uma2 family endonuclease